MAVYATTPFLLTFAHMSLLKSLAKETAVYGLSYSLGRVLNFLLVTSYLTRVFSAERAFLSIYQDLYFYIGLCLGILTLRMETSFFRFASEERTQAKIYPVALKSIVLATAGFILGVVIFRKEVEEFLKYPDAAPLLNLSLGIVVLDVMAALPFAKLRFEKKAMRYAWIKLGGVVLNILLAIAMISWNSGDTGSEKLQWVMLANLISSLVVLAFLTPQLLEGFTRADWSLAKELFRYTLPLMAVTVSYLVIQNGSVSFLKYLLPGTYVENFDVSSEFVAASRLAILMSLFVTAFNYAAEPFFFRHARREYAPGLYAKVSLYFLIACCFVYMLTCLFIDLAALLVDKNFRGSLHLVSNLMLANFFAGMYTNFSSWYKLTDRTLTAACISISGLVLSSILNVVFIPLIGISAAAWSILLSYILISALSYWQGQKHFPIPYDMKRMFAFLMVSIVIVIALPALADYLAIGLILRYGMYGLALVGCCLLIYWDWRKNPHVYAWSGSE